MKAKNKLALAAAAALSISGLAGSAQATIVYSDAFDRATLNGGTYQYQTVLITGAGTIPATSINDGGAVTDGSVTNSTANQLTLTNDLTGTAIQPNNFNGAVYVTTPTSAYTGGFNNVLSNNTGNILTWTLNMQQIRSNPSGTAAGNYGSAYVLGATASNFGSTGSGYAVVIGNGGTGVLDPVRLVKFTNGVASIGTSANTSAFQIVGSGTDNVGTDYMSVKVTYDPSSNNWTLYTRDDGTAFVPPTSGGAFQTVGSAPDTTATTTPLTYSGAYWAYSTTPGQTARFDNFQLDVSASGASTAATPRNLVWGSASSGGNWETSNAWLDSLTPATWDSARPDNATFGQGTGSGTATITLGSAQTAGSLTFAANSPTYTLAGANLSVTGVSGVGVVAHKSATILNTLQVSAGQSWTVDAAQTLTIGNGSTGALAGASSIIKNGTGDIILNTPTSGFSGAWTLNGGTMKITAVDANGRGGNGTGNITVNSGATVWIADVKLGNNGATNAGDVTIGMTLNNGATLQGTGANARYSGATAPAVSTTAGTVVTFKTLNSGDVFNINSSVRGSGNVSATSNNKVVVSGPGRIYLSSGATSAASSANHFAGSWELQSGILQVGPVISGGQGEPLNALGYSPADGPNGAGNVVEVLTGATLAVGTAAHNQSQSPINADSFRARVTLSGGSLGSTAGISAPMAGNLTTTANTTSKVLAYDPVNPSNPSSFDLVTDINATNSPLLNFGANSTLVVDPGTTSGGALNIARETAQSGATTVGAGAKIQVNNGASLHLGATVTFGLLGTTATGTADSLSDGTNHVSIVNNGTFNVQNGVKNVGAVTGSGSTNVSSGVQLRAKGVRQGGALNIANGAKVVSRKSGSNLVRVDTLNLNSNGTLDLEDNDLIVDHGNFATIIAKRWEGYRDAPDTSATGIISSAGQTITGAPILAVFDNSIAGFGDWPFGSGETIGNTAVVGQFTYIGDADLNGQVTPDDYGAIDSNLGAHVGTAEETGGMNWLAGDWNFDGDITPDDYGGVDANLGNGQTQGPQLGAAGMIAANGLAAVPEPTSLGLLGVAGLGMLSRRRRSR
ncbi:MAG TPA: PEP-CTERM sorting domain-containing protein [Tepidisphaeraceae bacterium]|jgi:hypothetical protein